MRFKLGSVVWYCPYMIDLSGIFTVANGTVDCHFNQTTCGYLDVSDSRTNWFLTQNGKIFFNLTLFPFTISEYIAWIMSRVCFTLITLMPDKNVKSSQITFGVYQLLAMQPIGLHVIGRHSPIGIGTLVCFHKIFEVPLVPVAECCGRHIWTIGETKR